MKRPLIGLGLAAMLVFGLAGCSGDDGAQGPAGPAGPSGPAGPPGQDATQTVKISELTAEQWASLTINGQVTKVTIASPPVVEFKLSDQNGKPIVGIGTNTSTSGGVTSYSNIRFELAKLTLGTAGSPDEWISYIVVANDGVTPSRPDTDRNGTLKDNGNGTYAYTFARDVTKVKDIVAAATVPAGSDKADLGDLTYDASLQHRLIIQISGSNAGAALENAVNVVYDFLPSTGAAIAAGRPEERPGRHQGLQRLPPEAGPPRRRTDRRPVLHDLPHVAAGVRPGQDRLDQRRLPGADGNEDRQRDHRDHQLLVFARHVRR